MALTVNVDRYQKFYANADLSEYAGQWIAIVDENVVAHSKNIKSVMEVVKKKYPNITPFITKVPAREILLW